MIALLLPLLMQAATIPSSPDLGIAEGRCRANETGPSFLVNIDGLRDRRGQLKLEVYPANDTDFLADDNILISAGKTFRRVVVAVPQTGRPQLCVRLPAAGTYSVTVLHDRNSDRRFSLSSDGVGFAGNPRLGFSRPSAAAASARAGAGPTSLAITMNYRRGLLGFGPIEQRSR